MSEHEYNSKFGMKRSNAVHNLIQVLIKQNKTFIEGTIIDKKTNTQWHYKVKKDLTDLT